jgi:hypothetical protein
MEQSIMKLTSKIAMTAIAAALMGMGGTASAAAFAGNTSTTCDPSVFSGLTVLDCSGWWSGNILQSGTVGIGTLLTALQALDSSFTSTSPYLQKVGDLKVNGTALNGLVGQSIIGIHYGGSGPGGNATVILRIDAGAGLNLSKLMVPQQGLSGAATFQTGGTVTDPCLQNPNAAGCQEEQLPVPGTIALFGLGMLGLGAARRKLA